MRTYFTWICKLFLHCPCLVLDIRAFLYSHFPGRRWQPFPLAGHSRRCPGRFLPPHSRGTAGAGRAVRGSAALPAPGSRGPPGSVGRRGRAWIWRESIKSRREARPPSCQSRRQRLGRGAGSAPWSTPTTTPGATTATTVSRGPRLARSSRHRNPGAMGTPLPREHGGDTGTRRARGSAGGGAEAARLSLAGKEEAKLAEGEVNGRGSLS